MVVAAKDYEFTEEELEIVAIKKIEGAFEHTIMAQRTLRELKIMRLLEHENILGIITIMKPSNKDNFKDIYVVT